MLARVLLAAALAVAGPASAQQAQPPSTIRQAMTEQEFLAAGLDKLSADEYRALQQWFDRYSARVSRSAQGAAAGMAPGEGYVVEDAVDEHFFLINGKLYRADTFCHGLNRGDRVIFAQGSALGVCATAKLVNLRTGDACDVWCQ